MRDAGAKINYAIVNTAPAGLYLFFLFFIFKEFARMAQHVRFVAANVSIFNKRVTATGIIIVTYIARLVLLHAGP